MHSKFKFDTFSSLPVSEVPPPHELRNINKNIIKKGFFISI